MSYTNLWNNLIYFTNYMKVKEYLLKILTGFNTNNKNESISDRLRRIWYNNVFLVKSGVVVSFFILYIYSQKAKNRKKWE